MADGYGKYIHTDGAIHEGNYFEDKKHGRGKETWPDGAQFEGNYEHGRKEGRGEF